MQERLIGGGVAAAISSHCSLSVILPFQLLVGAMAMVAVSEMLHEALGDFLPIEGYFISQVAAFILAVPIDQYFYQSSNKCG